MTHHFRRARLATLFLGLPLGLSHCGKPFDVNVGTSEPIQVNLSMDVHVYQHGEGASEEEQTARASVQGAMEGRRNRMNEIQNLKNSRLVGEGHKGLLSVRNLPAGEYGKYVRETVEAENQDREVLMASEAKEQSLSVAEVRRVQWQQRQRKAFPGEWIQVEGEEPGFYRWMRKEAGQAAE